MTTHASTIQAALARDLRADPSDLDPDVPFPDDTFPPQVEDWLTASANALRAPVAWLAFPFLAFTGALVGTRLRLQLNPAWHESPNLWVALVGPAGSGKSTALIAVRQPFEYLHYLAWNAYRKGTSSWATTGRPPAPFDPLLTTNCAFSQVAKTLRHSTGLCIHRDELYGLLRAIDRRQGEDRQLYRSLWSGDPLFDPNLDPRADVYQHVVAIVGGIQPLLLRNLRHEGQDGLLERFLLVFPSGMLTRWTMDLPAQPPGWREIAGFLAPIRDREAQEGASVRLDPAARVAWTNWFNANLEAHAQVSPALGSFYRKLPTQLARIALILHVLWNIDEPVTPVTVETIERAIRLVDYLRVHIHRAAWVIDGSRPAPDPMTTLRERITRALSQQQDWMIRTHLARALGRPPTATFDAALAALIRERKIETRTRRPRSAGHPATEYRLANVTPLPSS